MLNIRLLAFTLMEQVHTELIHKRELLGDAWVAQLVKHMTLDLSSGLDLKVLSSNPALGSTLGMEPT